MRCPACGAALEFAPELAGQSGPCYRCGGLVQVPPAVVVSVCSACHTASEFHVDMIGQSGPCRGCGQTMTVTPTQSGAPHAGGEDSRFREVEPSSVHLALAKRVSKEAQKAQVNTGRPRVISIGETVSAGEAIGSALKASFSPFGGKVRRDRAMGIPLERHGERAVVVFPFSGNRVLAHEFGSILPGTLPTSLWLQRSATGAWGEGRFTTPHGDNIPVAAAAGKNRSLVEGIEWNLEQGRSVIKLRWGLQLVALGRDRSLHVMQTADQGIVFKSAGLSWYFDRRAAMGQFLAESAFGRDAEPPRYYQPVLSELFLDMLSG